MNKTEKINKHYFYLHMNFPSQSLHVQRSMDSAENLDLEDKEWILSPKNTRIKVFSKKNNCKKKIVKKKKIILPLLE